MPAESGPGAESVVDYLCTMPWKWRRCLLETNRAMKSLHSLVTSSRRSRFVLRGAVPVNRDRQAPYNWTRRFWTPHPRGTRASCRHYAGVAVK